MNCCKEYKAHPLMIWKLLTPFLIILVLPVLKAVIQYFRSGTVGSVYIFEFILLVAILSIAIGRWRCFRVECNGKTVRIESGIFFKTNAEIDISKLSCIQIERGISDYIFGALTFKVNTEAGTRTKSDFEFKLSRKDGTELAEMIYGETKLQKQRFSTVKVALLAVTTSSAFAGIVIGIPLINRAGKLFGIALSKMLFDEINNVSSKIETKFPPIVNAVTLILLLAYMVSFIYQFFKFINFKIAADDNRIEVQNGFFTREKTMFKHSSVNNIRIEQSPIMLLINKFTMKVSVAGFSNYKNESQILVPIGNYSEIKEEMADYFPFYGGEGYTISPDKSFLNITRFLYWPTLFLLIGAALSLWTAHLFLQFAGFIRFLAFVGLAFDIIYYYVSYIEYRRCNLVFGESICVSGKRRFLRTCELHCNKEKVGEIKIWRVFTDFTYNTCKIRVTVCSEGADSLMARHIDYNKAIEAVKASFGNVYE